MKTHVRLALLGICCVLGSYVQAEGDPKAGGYAFDTCKGCHGIPGYTNAYPTYHVPRLGGQHPEYIIAALQAYQQGDRRHPTMHANAYSLTQQEMVNIAAYLAEFPSFPKSRRVRGNIAAGKTKSSTCVACHGEDGNGLDPINPTYPRLAGQHEDYLRQVLQEYKSGKRKNAIMNGMAQPLSKQDQADLAAYFASQPNGLIAVSE